MLSASACHLLRSALCIPIVTNTLLRDLPCLRGLKCVSQITFDPRRNTRIQGYLFASDIKPHTGICLFPFYMSVMWFMNRMQNTLFAPFQEITIVKIKSKVKHIKKEEEENIIRVYTDMYN